MRGRRDSHGFNAAPFQLRMDFLPVVLCFNQIDLVEGHDLQFAGQPMTKRGQLGVDGVEPRDRVRL
jgi:hypothetical protein